MQNGDLENFMKNTKACKFARTAFSIIGLVSVLLAHALAGDIDGACLTNSSNCPGTFCDSLGPRSCGIPTGSCTAQICMNAQCMWSASSQQHWTVKRNTYDCVKTADGKTYPCYGSTNVYPGSEIDDWCCCNCDGSNAPCGPAP